MRAKRGKSRKGPGNPVALKNLLTVCGLSSVRAIAAQSPQLIERLFFDETNAPHLSEACRYLAKTRKIYRLVKADELKKITDTAHHQGVAVVIHEPVAQPLQGFTLSKNSLCLHDVLNPHNVGAILRTAAFFGFQAILVSQKTYSAAMTSAAWRVAEGGLSHTKLYAYSDTAAFFAWAKSADVITAAAVRPDKNARKGLSDMDSKKTTVICLGNEEDGLPAAFVKGCSTQFSIAGSGNVESLNVSVTAALCMANLLRA